MASIPRAVREQYRSPDPLKTRIEIHRRYSAPPLDLDAESRARLDLEGGESLVEVGCGPGAFLRYLRGSGFGGPLAGLDQSASMIAEATAACAGLERPIGWIVGDAAALPFPGAAFDRVVARHMLYHVSDREAAVREFGRVLRPGGSALLTTNVPAVLPGIRALANDILNRYGPVDRPPGARGDPTERFNTANAGDFLRSAFRDVEGCTIPGALVFTEPEPIVAYIATMGPFLTMQEDAVRWVEVQACLLEEAKRRLDRCGGVWRDPKGVGIYLCRSPRRH